MRRLRGDGFDVMFACSPSDGCADIAAEGFRFVPNYISRAFSVRKHLKSMIDTYKMLRREQVDILHVHTPVASLIARPMAALAGIPVVIYTVHGFYFHENMSWYKRWPHIIAEWLAARFTDFMFMVSAEDAATAQRLHIMPASKMLTIYNGVDMDHFDPARFSTEDKAALRSKLAIPPDAPVVGIVGRLVREKGFYEFFEAAAQIKKSFPNARFLIVGDVLLSDYDTAKQDMIARTKELAIADSLIWSGLVADTAPYLALMDVFCLPSHREGMPVSMLEAMSMALPAVATNIRGCREEVVDGVTGYLIPVRDSAALAEKVAALLDDRANALKMGLAGRERVRAMFEINKVVQVQTAVFKQFAEKIDHDRQ